MSLGDSIALLFSEPMNRGSVENAFIISPPVEYRERRWRKNTWILRLRRPLLPHRTYVGLLSTAVKDHHDLSPTRPWSFAFSTGDTLDTGQVSGKVVGQRYAPAGAFVYVWPWSAGPPDTTKQGYPPDPVRLGQADAQGAFTLDYLPRDVELRLCALYDRGHDQQFDPGSDRWGCAEQPVSIADTAKAAAALSLYISDPDEPGTVGGTAIDSLCVKSRAGRLLARTRAQRDSLRQWLEGRSDTSARTGGAAPGPPAREPITLADSLRIGHELLSIDSLSAAAKAESAYCATPIVTVLEHDTTLVRQEKGQAKFQWTDVPPGTYRLHSFRDLNGDGREEANEPSGSIDHPLEVKPLHAQDSLNVILVTPSKEK